MATAKRKTAITSNDIYGLYEQALKDLYARDYSSAKSLLNKIEEEFPQETEVLARVRSLLVICQQRLDSQANHNHQPTTREDFYNLGVLLHNSGQALEAFDHFRKALAIEGKDVDYILFAMAASLCQQGKTKEALDHLKRAVDLSPEYVFAAANDPDFDSLAGNEEFRKLFRT